MQGKPFRDLVDVAAHQAGEVAAEAVTGEVQPPGAAWASGTGCRGRHRERVRVGRRSDEVEVADRVRPVYPEIAASGASAVRRASAHRPQYRS
jgi:hypothetical protein